MLLSCNYCPMQVNGMLQREEHERLAHPKEYWNDRADRAEKEAKKQTELAKQFRDKALTY